MRLVKGALRRELVTEVSAAPFFTKRCETMTAHRMLIVASVVVLTLVMFSLPMLAADKPWIRIVNEHSSAELQVEAYDANDQILAVTCQRLSFSRDQVRHIIPWTAEGLDKLFDNHCGNYERLKIVVTARFDDSTLFPTKNRFPPVIVPWGATITLHRDGTPTCDGCTW